MENYSAIMQMFNGQRGKAESVVPSQTYKAHLDECIKVQEKIKEKLKENPDLIALFDKWEWAMLGMEATAADDYYREGFSFGLLMGLEVGMSATKLKNGE